jgi:hypothetical protein
MDDGRTITRALLWCIVVAAALFAVLDYGTRITRVAADSQAISTVR